VIRWCFRENDRLIKLGREYRQRLLVQPRSPRSNQQVPFIFLFILLLLIPHAILIVLTDTQVGKITFSSLRATGVEFQSSGTTRTIRASSEIIMAAGSIGTPKILQHSGIGPRSVLSSAGVPTILDLPVGMGLVDQVTTTTNWQFAEQRGGGQVILFPSFDDLFQGNEADRMRSILENDLAGYASAAQDAGAVPNGDALLKVLEIQRDWILNRNAGIAESFDYSYSSGGSVNTLGYDSWYLLPFGRGSVKITNSDAYDTAALSIDPRYFSTEFDRLAQGAITRFTRTVSLAQPLASVVQSEGTPGDQVPQGASLDEWADWSERNYRSNWHPIGTVGMMSRDMGGCVGSDYKLVSLRSG
jgi:choline dehydrogenase-like flavoprotein